MKPIIFAALVFAVPTAASADDAESQMNEAGVAAVEHHWGAAEVRGDDAYLATLLDDDYISVGAKGVAHTKADIIAFAAKNKNAPAPASASTPAAPKIVPKITIHGNTALVTSTGFGQLSVDVFHYENGTWHAWYSQHTPLPAPT
jgi:hypothetical protein